MRGRVRQYVQLEVHGADEVQAHLDVEHAAGDDPARVQDAADEEVGGQGKGPRRGGEDEGEGGEEADRAGDGAGGAGVAVEVVPGEEARAAQGGPGEDGGEEDWDAISGWRM